MCAMTRQEVAFLKECRKIKGCGIWIEEFYTKFKPIFKDLGCDMADELKFIEQAINKAETKKSWKIQHFVLKNLSLRTIIYA